MKIRLVLKVSKKRINNMTDKEKFEFLKDLKHYKNKVNKAIIELKEMIK